MPKTKTAKKALRQNARHYKSNLAAKKKLREVFNTFKNLAATGKIDEAKKYLSTVYKTFDKAVKANLIKKNKARRIKSRFAKKLKNQLK